MSHDTIKSVIVTVTLNPSVDRTISVDSLKVGSVNRGALSAIDPGGKGVNVSRALASYGKETFAILVCGELGDLWFASSLRKLGIEHRIVKAEGITRSNITLVEYSGTVTKINEPGLTLTVDTMREVKEVLAALELRGAWVVLAGRLNPGADPMTYKELGEYARELGAKIALDSSGPEFKAALAMKPDLIKPNHFELGELVGRELVSIQDVIEAGKEVLHSGVNQVLCSLGVDGAVLVSQDGVVHCEPERVAVGTPVGAGDILLAIYLGGGAQPSALRDAIAWSAASVPLEGTGIPTKEEAKAVGVIENKSPVAQRELAEVH